MEILRGRRKEAVTGAVVAVAPMACDGLRRAAYSFSLRSSPFASSIASGSRASA
jgi:hypothetical protein